MALDTTQLKAAYTAAINARLSGIAQQQALVDLESYCQALNAEYSAAASHLSAYSIANRSATYRDTRSAASAAAYYRRRLDSVLGEGIGTVTLLDASRGCE